jgi:hypothetical protein
MAADIFATNRESVLHWLDRYIEELSAYRHLIASAEGEKALHDQLSSVRDGRDEFMAGRGFDRGTPRSPVDLPTASSSLTGLLIPPWAQEKMRNVDSGAAARAKEMAEGVRRDLENGNGRGRS